MTLTQPRRVRYTAYLLTSLLALVTLDLVLWTSEIRSRTLTLGVIPLAWFAAIKRFRSAFVTGPIAELRGIQHGSDACAQIILRVHRVRAEKLS